MNNAEASVFGKQDVTIPKKYVIFYTEGYDLPHLDPAESLRHWSR